MDQALDEYSFSVSCKREPVSQMTPELIGQPLVGIGKEKNETISTDSMYSLGKDSLCIVSGIVL